MKYIFNVDLDKYNNLISLNYPLEILIFKDEYQNIKNNDIFEYHYNDKILTFYIRRVVYSNPNNTAREIDYSDKIKTKETKEIVHNLINNNLEEVKKYGVIYIFLSKKNNDLIDIYSFNNNECILDYLILEKEYLNKCEIYNEEIYNKEPKETKLKKIRLPFNVVNPHLLHNSFRSVEFLTIILNIPLNLIQKIMRFQVYLVKENDKYIFVSREYYFENKELEYLEEKDIINYLFTKYDIEEDINQEENEIRKKVLQCIKEKEIINKYLFINEIIVPDIIIERIINKVKEPCRIDDLYYFVCASIKRIEKVNKLNAPYIIRAHERMMLNNYLQELITNLSVQKLLKYYDFNSMFEKVEIKEKDIFYMNI